MQQIRKAGCYRADEELAVGVSSLSVPVRFAPKEHCAALALVSSTQHFAQSNVGEWQDKLKKAARRIALALGGE